MYKYLYENHLSLTAQRRRRRPARDCCRFFADAPDCCTNQVTNTNLNCIADVSAPQHQPINNCQMCYMTAKKLNMNFFLKNIKKC